MTLTFLRLASSLVSAAAVLAATVAPASAVPLTLSSAAGTAAASESAALAAAEKSAARRAEKPLRVASFNIRCANCFDGYENEEHWSVRRTAVVATIEGQDPDVVGVQEASQGRVYDAETGSRNLSQFDDLLNRLGSPWRVTNSTRYNCVKDMSPNHCRYVYKGASDSNRIFYNSDRVALVAEGSKKLPSPKVKGDNYMAWAEFKQLSTGKSFMFSDLHTVSEDKYHTYKKRQAVAAAAELKRQNSGNLPMIAVGDWNSSRFERPSNGPYDAYVSAGFHDPLGGKYRTTHTAPGAFVDRRVNTTLSSSNSGWDRKAPAHRDWVNGSYIDYIMMTKMAVREWETVANLDSSGRYIGTIPSDHNMVRADVVLP